MTMPFEASIARLRTAEGSIVGAGFLVDEGRVLTCAHVVADALGIPRDAEEKPISTLHLDFPLVAPDDIRTAHVTLWQSGDDIAGLELEGDPPAAARFVRLVTAQDLWLHPFRAFGFPTSYDDGVWASGVLRGRQATGWVQIEDLKEPGYWVQPGFSGTPVWDEQLNGVVGMAVAADTSREVKAAFMIPASKLIETWPELAKLSLDANSLEYLQQQLAVLEAAQQKAPDPHRFQSRIDELRAAIANWAGRVERQRQRIAEGLEEQRRRLEEDRARWRAREPLRVVGRPPLDVADYFKNRERELTTLGRLLAEPTTRLVSVIGHGGMGKTALACKVLQDLERHRRPYTGEDVPVDGIVYLSTRTAGISLERLFLDCAKALGGAEEKQLNAIWTNPQLGTEDKVTHLLEAFKDGQYVILLDNIEDLLDDQGQFLNEDLQIFFGRCLATSHGARLLVTSRVALAFRLDVMRFDRQVKLLKGLPAEDGVALLRELDPNGDRGLRDAPEERLTESVELAHGVPRALEVLAGILANDPFAALDEVLETFYEQEDVVQALIEENYKRLDSQARRVIEALAVFRRPVPPVAVDYLLEPFAQGLDVPSIVRRLVGTNIVSVDRATKTVTLHPIDQDYAYSQLPEEEIGEPVYTRQALERRAADYYVHLRTPPETWKTIDDLESQLAEFEHRVRAEDFDDAYRVLVQIDFEYLDLWGHFKRLVELRMKLLGHLTSINLQANNLGSLGRAYRALGRFEQAIGLYEQALVLSRKLGDRQAEGNWLGNLGLVSRNIGQVEQAIKFYEDALLIAREIGDRRFEGVWLGYLGWAHHDLGQVERAINFYKESLAIAREINHRPYEGVWLGTLGLGYRDLGLVQRAIKLYKEALSIAREIGNRRYEIVWLNNLGNAYCDLNQSKSAIKLYEEALALAREMGYRLGESHSLLGLGKSLLSIGKLSEARQRCAEASDLNVPETGCQVALTLGIVLLHQRAPAALDGFADAATRCQARLDKTPGLYEPRYALATALVGQAVCDPRWPEQGERVDLLIPALAEYQRALEICSAPGVIQDALRDLELIRAAGIEGLEPVFELLEGAKAKNEY